MRCGPFKRFRGMFLLPRRERHGMDTDRILELVPHYLAMILIVFGVLWVVRTTVGDLGFLPELVIVVVVLFLYRPVVIRLGIAPSMWERRS